MYKYLTLIIITIFLVAAPACKPKKTTYSQSDLNSYGVRVRQEGDRVYWNVPMWQTHDEDKKALNEKMINEFKRGLKDIKEKFAQNGVDLEKVAITDNAINEHADKVNFLIKTVVDWVSPKNISEVGTAEKYNLENMTDYKRYLIPQAVYTCVGGTFQFQTPALSFGVTATVYVVVQPWLSVIIDSKTGEELDRKYDVIAVSLVLPGIQGGVGIGMGVSAELGAGVILGPLNNITDLSGVALGAKGAWDLTSNIAGGTALSVMVAAKNPPLIYVHASYLKGLSANVGVKFAGQIMITLDDFLNNYIPNKAKEAPLQNQ